MRHGNGYAYSTLCRTETVTILCPVCRRRRAVKRALLEADRITITCSASCHSLWRERLLWLLRQFPDMARKPDAMGYYAKREFVPQDVIEMYYERMTQAS